MSRVHSTAVVAAGAEIADDVQIGAYCCVGEEATIEPGVVLHPHVVVAGKTRIGAGTVVYPFASLGQPPQLNEGRPAHGLKDGFLHGSPVSFPHWWNPNERNKRFPLHCRSAQALGAS